MSKTSVSLPSGCRANATQVKLMFAGAEIHERTSCDQDCCSELGGYSVRNLACSGRITRTLLWDQPTSSAYRRCLLSRTHTHTHTHQVSWRTSAASPAGHERERRREVRAGREGRESDQVPVSCACTALMASAAKRCSCIVGMCQQHV